MNRYNLGLLGFSGESSTEVLQRISSHVRGYNGSPLTVVTPNISHFYLAKKHCALTEAINDADISLPDGWPVSLALKIFHGYDKGRITGSDLSVELLNLAEREGLSVGILGGSDSSLTQAYQNVALTHPRLKLVEMPQNPHLPTEPTPQSVETLAEAINASTCDILLLCMGAPKSEAHLYAARRQIGSKAVLCVGATVDFLAGSVKRAPRWVQRAGLEWAYRLWQEPVRLGDRYLKSGICFISVILRETVSKSRVPGKATVQGVTR